MSGLGLNQVHMLRPGRKIVRRRPAGMGALGAAPGRKFASADTCASKRDHRLPANTAAARQIDSRFQRAHGMVSQQLSTRLNGLLSQAESLAQDDRSGQADAVVVQIEAAIDTLRRARQLVEQSWGDALNTDQALAAAGHWCIWTPHGNHTAMQEEVRGYISDAEQAAGSASRAVSVQSLASQLSRASRTIQAERTRAETAAREISSAQAAETARIQREEAQRQAVEERARSAEELRYTREQDRITWEREQDRLSREREQAMIDRQREERQRLITEEREAEAAEQAATSATEQARAAEERRMRETQIAAEERLRQIEEEKVIREEERELRREERGAELRQLQLLMELAAKGISIPAGMIPGAPALPAPAPAPAALPAPPPGYMYAPAAAAAAPSRYKLPPTDFWTAPPGFGPPPPPSFVPPGFSPAMVTQPTPYAPPSLAPPGYAATVPPPRPPTPPPQAPITPQVAAPPPAWMQGGVLPAPEFQTGEPASIVDSGFQPFQTTSFAPGTEIFGLGAMQPVRHSDLQGAMIEPGYTIEGPYGDGRYKIVRPDAVARASGNEAFWATTDQLEKMTIRDPYTKKVVYHPPAASGASVGAAEEVGATLREAIRAAADIYSARESRKAAQARGAAGPQPGEQQPGGLLPGAVPGDFQAGTRGVPSAVWWGLGGAAALGIVFAIARPKPKKKEEK